MTEASRKRTVLDRSLVCVLPSDEDTASCRDGVSATQERLQRLHGTAVMYDGLRMLQCSSCFATACTIFHRFYHQTSLRQVDVWSVALGSALLAVKTEEVSVSLKHLILAFIRVYQRRRLILLENESEVRKMLQHPSVVDDPFTKLTLTEKHNKLKDQQSFSQLGPFWKDWHTAAIETENRILRQLGFTLHWIPDEHPHKFLVYILRLLELDSIRKLAQKAWNYCNDACRLDLRFSSHLIACASVHLAALEHYIVMPSQPWWEVVCGPGHEHDLSTIANALLALSCGDDVMVATHAMIPSLMQGEGSFNDPHSFAWEYAFSAAATS